MSVVLLLPSKEINEPTDKVQGPGINVCYNQDVHGKEEKTTEGENCNEFTIMQFVMIHLLIMGCYILQKGQ